MEPPPPHVPTAIPQPAPGSRFTKNLTTNRRRNSMLKIDDTMITICLKILCKTEPRPAAACSRGTRKGSHSESISLFLLSLI